MARFARLEFDHATVLTPDGRCILNSVNLSIAPGERLVLMGPAGAGKTTLLRLAFGALTPTAGKVWLDGCSVRDLPATDRARRIALLVQNDAPEPRLSVADYVALGRVPHQGYATAAADRRAVAAALSSAGIEDLTRRQIGTLSGTERQRAAIARAVAQEPSLLLLDEPTTRLDPRGRIEMLAMLRELGITIVAVLHDPALVSAFADNVALLKTGCLVATGDIRQTLSVPTMREAFSTECFIASSPASGRDFVLFDTPAKVA